MHFRKARLEDYEQFKILYEDKGEKYQILFGDQEESMIENAQVQFDDELEEIRLRADKEYTNFTIQKYQKHLKWFHVYMIESEKQVIGSISLRIGGGSFQIIQLGMFDSKDENIREILEWMMNKFKIKKIFACVVPKSLQEIFVEMGFKETYSCYYELNTE